MNDKTNFSQRNFKGTGEVADTEADCQSAHDSIFRREFT